MEDVSVADFVCQETDFGHVESEDAIFYCSSLEFFQKILIESGQFCRFFDG